MINLNILESFRTKEELINYFDEMGQNLTEEEINALKKSYEDTETNGSTLTMQQLGNVAGGMKSAVRHTEQIKEQLTTALFSMSPEERISRMRGKHQSLIAGFIFENQHDPRITEEEKHVANDVYLSGLPSEQRLALLKDPDMGALIATFYTDHMADPGAIGMSRDEMIAMGVFRLTGGRTTDIHSLTPDEIEKLRPSLTPEAFTSLFGKK